MHTADRSTSLRVVAIADADSYVKWSAAMLDSITDARPHLVIVRTPLTVSEHQQAAAVRGTAIGPSQITRLEYNALAAWLAADRPDVVIIAGRGPLVRIILRAVDSLPRRPVVVGGLPGISIPAQRGAVLYRRNCDLMLVQSVRERRAFTELARRLGVKVEFALATLPFAVRRERTSQGTDLVFAAQAIVPRGSEDRERVADILRRAALADPDRRVVVKLRSRRTHGETETHHELSSYEDLLRDRPENLVFSYGSMGDALESAEGLVTVSSTAAIEALSRSIPVIALDTFGVNKDLLNTVFAGSGVLGSADDVIARRFRHPHPVWLRDNYFHDPAAATWWERTVELVRARRRGELPEKRMRPARGGPLHEAWQRKAVLGHLDRSVAGYVALATARPLVRAVLALRRFRRSLRPVTTADTASDFTLAPATYQDPIVRRVSPGASVLVD